MICTPYQNNLHSQHLHHSNLTHITVSLKFEESSLLWETDLITGMMSNDHKMIKRAFNRMHFTRDTHPGKIATVNKDGTYDVAFADGFKEPNVPIKRIHSLTMKDKNNQPVKFVPGQLTVGDLVDAPDTDKVGGDIETQVRRARFRSYAATPTEFRPGLLSCDRPKLPRPPPSCHDLRNPYAPLGCVRE